MQLYAELDRVAGAGVAGCVGGDCTGCTFVHSVWARRRFPFGAGFILGVYVTVLVTTSRICLTLLVEGFEARQSVEYRALRAASQSNGERTDRALKGERTVGESTAETAGDWGT